MKKLFRLSILSILLLIPNSLFAEAPAITALTITDGPTEGASYVGILGTGFTKDTVFQFDNERVIFKRFIDPTRVYILTVEHLQEGPVDVSATNSEGTGVLPSAFTFQNTTPALNRINLDNGVTEGNTSIHFYGSHFTSDMTVTFGDGESIVRRFYHSRRMKCFTPPHSAGAVDVTVTNIHGTDVLSGAYTFQNDPPVITRILPEEGIIQGGTLIRIWGRNFRATDTWDFGGSPSELQTFTYPGGGQQIIDSNCVRVMTTSHEVPEPVSVSVISHAGTTSVDGLYTYTASPPEITTISPNKGFPDGGSSTWIWGSNFTEDMTVDFGGSPATITRFRNSSLVRVRTSAHDPGLVNVTATTENGSVINHSGFTYLDTIPVISYLWPNNGVIEGNTYVTIRGRNFKESGTTVCFGETEQEEINVRNSNALRLKTVAVAAPCAVDVHVNTDEGEGILDNGFVFTQEKPTIIRVYPLKGLTSGNQRLYIYGANFTEDTIVRLDNVVHPIDRFYHSDRLRIKTLAHEEGKVDVIVENPRGSSILEKGYEYLGEMPPETPEGVPYIRYIIPAKGPVSGGTLVTIVGENFSRDMISLFGNEPVNLQRYYNDKKIRIITPSVSSSGTVDITVSDEDGSTTLTDAFRYTNDPPAINTIIPAQGFVYGGTYVTVYGNNFSKDIELRLGGIKAKLHKFYHSGAARFLTSPGTEGPCDVTITTKDGSATLDDGYIYAVYGPQISKVSPNHGPPSGGNRVAITGSFFTPDTRVYFEDVEATNMQYHHTRRISMSAPEKPAESTLTVDITVQTSFGQTTDANAYTYDTTEPMVSISANPETIQTGGSSTLTWSSTDANSCVIEPGIGSVPVNGSTTISPAETTTYTITATGPGGTATDSVTVTVTHPLPTVSISANPETVMTGESSILTWTSTNADSATIDQGIGSVPVNGSTSVSPTETTTYTITATGPGGTATDSAIVTVITSPEDVDYGLDTDEQQGGGGLVGETVRVLNGNALDSRTDLRFPSPHRLGLAFQAVYNSRSGTTGFLGYGWSHIYGAALDPSFNHNGVTYLKVVDSTGRARYFLEGAPGEYAGAFKERSHVKLESGEYVWYRLNGTKYGFSATGQLSWIDDEKGNRLNLAYDAQERPQTVTDATSGRTLTFNYNADSRLESISGPVTAAVPSGIWVSYGYDTNGNLTSVTYAEGSGFGYTYNDPNDIHNLTEKLDKADHLLNTWAYDSQDRCVNNFNVRGSGVNISYVSESQVGVTDAYGTLRSYTLNSIDGRKRVTAMSGIAGAPYSDNNAIRWVYDTEMRLIEVEYKGGTINRYQDYDDRGNPGTVRLASGTPEQRIITYTFHPEINVPLTRTEVSVLGGGNKVTIWDYDTDYNTTPNENPAALLSRIVEQGFTKNSAGGVISYEHVTTLTYNAKGQVISIDGPKPGNTDITNFSYDGTTGNLLSLTRPLIGSTTFSGYDASGKVGLITDVNGQSKGFSYDGRGRITTITNNADSSSTTIAYNTAGQPQSVTDPDSITRSFDYDTDYGRLTRITDMEGDYIAYQYDAQGNKIEMSKHAASGTRTYRKRWDFQQPDMPGKLFKEIRADDTFTGYGYDNDGNIASVIDNEGNTTMYDYDPLNRLTTVTQPGNAVSSYGYDTHGNLVSVSDAEGHQTIYNYDDMGRVVSTSSPDTGTVTHVYDEAGNPVEKTDAKGITVTYTYDILNRIMAIHFPDSAQDISYTYDAGVNGMGRRTGITDPSGIMTFAYDARGRLTGKTSDVYSHSYTVGTTYSPGNRVMNVTYPSGRSMDYTRDTMGRMKDLATTYDGNTVTLISNMTYNPFGSPKGISTGSGGEVDNVSGECGCVTVANPGEQMERTFNYDGNSNLTSIVGTNTPWYNQTFTYDALNRLINAEGMYGTIGYTYDMVGNRVTRTVNDDTENYSYLPGTNKLDTITDPGDTVTYTYDENGNITGIGDKVLSYNQNNRLIRVEEDSTVLGEYTYNGSGQRVVKASSGVTTIYHYDLNGKLIAESEPDGAMTKEYLYMGKIRTAMVEVSSGAMYYYLNDRLGSPLLMTDDTGTVVWEAYYKPFGEATTNPNSSVVNNIRLPGQYYDQETGLHYNYHRYYNPKTGRYLRADPIGLVGGINLYPYVQNNPILLIDPLGLIDWDEIKKAFKRPEDSAIRTAVQLLDIVPIPHPVYQISMEVSAAITTGIDIWVADVSWYRKLAAGAVTVYGLGGAFQMVPTAPTILLGTAVDLSAFVAIAYLLGDDPCALIERMIDNSKLFDESESSQCE